jgi:hypothetical protein
MWLRLGAANTYVFYAGTDFGGKKIYHQAMAPKVQGRSSLLHVSFQLFIKVFAGTRQYDDNVFFIFFNNGVGQFVVKCYQRNKDASRPGKLNRAFLQLW